MMTRTLRTSLRRTGLVLVLGLATLQVQAEGGLAAVRQGALHGDAAKQLQLGELYQFGSGLKDHNVHALAWYLAAARQGNTQAARFAKGLEKSLPAAAVAQARAHSKLLMSDRKAPKSTITPLHSKAPSP